MKRIFIAALLALGIHGFLLGMECTWLKRLPPERSKDRTISMTLAIRQPPIPTEKVEQITPITPLKPPARPKTRKKKRISKPISRPIRQKVIEPPVQTMKQDLSKVTPDVQSEPSEAFEQTEIKTIFQDIAKEGERKPLNPIIVEAKPMYRVNPRPRYPAMARKRGYTGTVVLEVLVSRNGNVADLRVLSSSGHSILDTAAISSVKNWLFEPAVKGDKKVDMWVNVPIRFEFE